MAIQIVCSCGKRFGVRDEYAGKRIKCPGCGQGVNVPIPALAAIDTSERDEDKGEPRPTPAPAPRPVPEPSVAERLDLLEKENGKLRRDVVGLQERLKGRTWAVVVSLLALAVLNVLLVAFVDFNHRISHLTTDVSSGTVLPRIIEAEGFVVKDSKGNVRATLGRTGHPTDDRHAETGLQLWTDGKERGSFVVDGHGWAVLSCKDSHEDQRLTLLGESDTAGLMINDRSGDQRLELSVSDRGVPMLVMNAKYLRPRLQMGVLNEVLEPAFFRIYDNSEKDYPLIDRNGLPLYSPR